MMMILNFCLHLSRAALLFFAIGVGTWAQAERLSLSPWQSLEPHFKEKGAEAWTDFRASDPVLWVVRGRVLDAKECGHWRQGLEKEALKTPASEIDRPEFFSAFFPLNEKEKEAIEECDSFPCKVKLDLKEVGILSSTLKKKREEMFIHLVRERVKKFKKTGERKEYEFAGDPQDPFKEFFEKGLHFGEKVREQRIFSRKLPFMKDDVLPLRQVLQREIFKNESPIEGLRTVVRTRDLYTDHYFDSWGEWGEVRCGSENIALFVLWVEFDLLKKKDLISLMSKGSMRSAVREHGSKFLKEWEDRIRLKP